jgi:hypothetical protein
MVIFRVLPRLSLASACSLLTEPNSGLTPLSSHSCEIVTTMHQKRANNPFRITFLKNGIRTNHLDSHSCANPGGVGVGYPYSLRFPLWEERIE